MISIIPSTIEEHKLIHGIAEKMLGNGRNKIELTFDFIDGGLVLINDNIPNQMRLPEDKRN